MNNNLGCGKRFKNLAGKQKEVKEDCDFICGVPDGWGKETLCYACDFLLKEKWAKEDKENIKLQRQLKGGLRNNDN